MRQETGSHSRAGVLGVVDDQVYTSFVCKSVTPWKHPLEVMLDLTLKMLQESADDVLLNLRASGQQTPLFKQVYTPLCQYFNHFKTSQREAVMELYNWEAYELFTINGLAMEEYRQQGLALL